VRILFDCRYTRTDRHDGISRFSSELVRALSERHPVEMLISDERQLNLLPALPWHKISAPTSAREPWVARQVNKLNPDVVYTPMQTMGDAGRNYRFVSTVHDLIYYSNRTPPRNLPNALRLAWRAYHLWWWPLRLTLNRADAVVTVSETTRGLIAKHKLTTREVVVVPNASTLPPKATRTKPQRRELVYMGSFMPYKDVDTLAKALHHLPGARLHLMSKARPADQERLLSLAPPDTLVFHDGASDEEYAAVLSEATALMSASRDEGFGIPLVEAMGFGTPVAVSDIPIFREIGGPGAAYFALGDSQAAADAVLELERNWDERSRLARAQAERFDWGTSADTLLELLLRV
jgi:glycosyltransferase involved in cell wall biosynthesis